MSRFVLGFSDEARYLFLQSFVLLEGGHPERDGAKELLPAHVQIFPPLGDCFPIGFVELYQDAFTWFASLIEQLLEALDFRSSTVRVSQPNPPQAASLGQAGQEQCRRRPKPPSRCRHLLLPLMFCWDSALLSFSDSAL